MGVRELLERIKSGSTKMEDAQIRLKNLPYEDLGYTKLNHRKKLRSGFGETILCQGRPDAYLLEIYKKFYGRDGRVLGIRASESQAKLVRTAVPEVVYGPISRVLKVEKSGRECRGCVTMYTGSTVNTPVAEKAAQAVKYFGCSVDRILGVGVIGIYRLLTQRECLGKANCIVAAAGMEGTLGTVIAGLVECPVMATPTFVGYDASFRGLSALLTMPSSCVNGISVVNIDNGYEAGYLTAQINKIAVR